ncbi:uncharacterized protein LOC143822031 [Paroedura picta]|uniref:uncharacterized protein LOC143822031 n=1 Tax=Paroedura picta TaxID=143630 RepID=UPI004055B090
MKRLTELAMMDRAELSQKTIQVVLGLILANSVLGLCPPRWIPYKEELCLYVADGPALTWSEARIFCQDQRAELVVIKNYNKQMFLTGLIDGARRRASHYWIGLMWQEAKAEFTWVDATPLPQSWYSNWLHGHPKKGRCVQLVGFYASQWRDWDCSGNSSFICEIPARDAFPGSVRKVRFSSYCYVFHFPSFREVRSWREAQALCQESGENLVTIHSEEDNAFLSYAFPVDGWYMWIGLRFGTAWKWSDSSLPVYFRWHPDEAPTKTLDQCAVLSLQPDDVARHGTWKTRSCNAHPTTEATGFICQHKHDFCGPPEPVEFPLPGGMGPYTTADVVFTLPAQSSCSLSLIGRYAYTTPFRLNLVSDATHVHGSIVAELGNISVYKNFPHVPFSPGLNTWSFITFPNGVASFFNHREHFRLSNAQDISFANLSSLQMSGVTVTNASLEYRLSSDLHFPSGSSLQLENAIRRYLGNFTIGLWVRSSFTLSPKMCLISYSLKWRPPEFALFLLSPSGLEFHVKGALMFSSTSGHLLDGLWHHVAVSVSSTPGVVPFQVFVDGESWEPDYADSTSFLHKGLPLGGTLSVGKLDVDSRGTRFYIGDLSEANLWDQVLSELSVKQLAASKTRWKYPGNVVSWNQLLAKRPVTVQISTSNEGPGGAFVWFGLLRLRGRSSVLCTDPERSRVYIEHMSERCLKHAFWGLQLNGQVRNIAAPSSCLLVAPDGISLLTNSNCSTDAKSSFRLLPDQRLQNLNSGFCLFQDVISSKLYLQKCTSEALYFALDSDVQCPQSRGWRARKNKCFFFMLNVALKWQQALKFCQRFLGGSLVMLNSLQDLAWLTNELPVSVWTGLHSSVEGSLSWANGTPLNKDLQRFVFSQSASNMISCMLALSSGFLKPESCQRPHRWICQTSRKSGKKNEHRLFGVFLAHLLGDGADIRCLSAVSCIWWNICSLAKSFASLQKGTFGWGIL